MKIYSKRHPNHQRGSLVEELPGGRNALARWAEVYPMEIGKITVPVMPKSAWDMKPIFASDFESLREVARAAFQAERDSPNTWSAIDDAPFFDAPIKAEDFPPLPPISRVELEETVSMLQHGIMSRKQFFGGMLEDAYRDLEAWRNDNK